MYLEVIDKAIDDGKIWEAWECQQEIVSVAAFEVALSFPHVIRCEDFKASVLLSLELPFEHCSCQNSNFLPTEFHLRVSISV